MKILFLYPKTTGLVSFVEKDAHILMSKYQVRLFPFDRIRNDFLSLLREVRRNDITFNWFCGLHALTSSLLSKVFGKRVVTIIGGYEVSKVPEINYGQLISGKNKYIPIWGLNMADIVIVSSEYSKMEAIDNTKIPDNKLRMIYHGFSEETFKRDRRVKKRNLVITIAKITNESAVNKGLELFVKSAKFIPDVEFMLIGPDIDGTGECLRKTSPKNVTFSGGIYGKSLAEICNQAKVYVQSSIHESFGCSVAEAMLCGCVPVVSNTSALPEVVGDTGLYIRNFAPEELAAQINDALEISHKKEDEVINRIRERFPLSLRKQRILEEIDRLTHS